MSERARGTRAAKKVRKENRTFCQQPKNYERKEAKMRVTGHSSGEWPQTSQKDEPKKTNT